MAPVRNQDEKHATNLHKLSKILRSKLLLIVSLVNFAIQLPLLIQVSLINHTLDSSLESRVLNLCQFVPKRSIAAFEDDISNRLSRDNSEIVTLVYSQFATLLIILVTSFHHSFSPYFVICSFVLIQIIWAIIQVTETISLRKKFNDDFGCPSALDSRRVVMESVRLAFLIVFFGIIVVFCWGIPKILAKARVLMRNKICIFMKGAENLLYISTYLWIGFSPLFAAEVVSVMSIAMIFVFVALSVAWFRLGWLTIHQRNGADLVIFLFAGFAVVFSFGNSLSMLRDASSWTFFMATWILSLVVATFTTVVVILTLWCTRKNDGHVQLLDLSEQTSFEPVSGPSSGTTDIESSANIESTTPQPAFQVDRSLRSLPPAVPPPSTRPDIVWSPQTIVQMSGEVNPAGGLSAFSRPEPNRNTTRGDSRPTSPTPVINNYSRPVPSEPVRNVPFAPRSNGLAQTSVMRRGSGGRRRGSSLDSSGNNGDQTEDPVNTTADMITPAASTITPTISSLLTNNLTPVSVPPPPPLLIIPPPPSLPRSTTPSVSDSQSNLSQSTFIPPSPPPPPPPQNPSLDTTTFPPSSFNYSSASSSSSSNSTRSTPDVPVSPTRRDTLASEYTIDTLPSYRSRSTTPVATEPGPLPSSFIPPMPPFPPLPSYPSLPSGPAQFLARRQTNSSIRTYATLPSYRSPTVGGSEVGSEAGDRYSARGGDTYAGSESGESGESDTGRRRERIRREDEQLPIGSGRRSSQRSIMSVPRSTRQR